MSNFFTTTAVNLGSIPVSELRLGSNLIWAAVPANYTWDAGGGSSRNINNPANWHNDVVPDLVSGTQTLTFATAAQAGTAQSFLNIKINVLGFVFNFNGNFRIIPTVASFSPSIGRAGILAQPNSDASALYTLSYTGASGVGATITSDQTWMVEKQGSFSTTLSVEGIAGEFNLIKDGSGTLTITRNSLRSDPTKSFTLKNGILQLQASMALNSSINAPLFINGGELRLSTNSDTTFTGTNIIVGGNASITTTRTSSTGVHPLQTIGNLSIGSHTLTVMDTNLYSSTGDAVLQTGAVTLTGSAVFNVVNTDNAGVLKLGDVGESGGSRGLTKTGDGTLVLTNNNSYTGSTSILVGTLRVEKLFSGPVEKFLFAEFTTGNLLVKFSSNPVAGESYKLLPGSTQQNFNTVILRDNADNIISGLTASYNSSNSTLSIS